MYISDLFKQKKTVFSIEVFPPKKVASPVDSMFEILTDMKGISPDFISVTFGAGGSAAGDSTIRLASFIKNDLGVESLAHLTCVNSSKTEIGDTLERLVNENIDNILALRGDINPDIPRKTDFLHASDLAAEIKSNGKFCVSGACYPELHPEAKSFEEDVENLGKKIEAGVSQLVTQLFFDNNKFLSFRDLAAQKGISVPIQAGIMPIVNKRQVERTVSMTNASLPKKFVDFIEKYDEDKEGFFKAGIEYSINQIEELVDSGLSGIHIYAMNNSAVAKEIFEAVRKR